MGLRDITLGVMIGGAAAAGATYAQNKIQAPVITRADIYRGAGGVCPADLHYGFKPGDVDVTAAFGEKGVVLKVEMPCSAIAAALGSAQIVSVDGVWPTGHPLPFPLKP